MSDRIRILHLEDSAADAELIQETLVQQGVPCSVRLAKTKDEFERQLASRDFDVILCDYNVPGYSGIGALQRVRQSDPDLPFILLSGSLGEEQAVESLKCGANDYILKNRLHRLGPAVIRAVQEYQEKLNRRKGEEALRLNEERLSCVLRATNDAVWDWDVSTGEIWWNHGLQMLFGYLPAGQKYDLAWWEASLHPAERQQVVESRRTAVSSNRQTWGEEYRFGCSDGSYAFVFDRGYIIRDEHGRAVRMIGSMMDITERKKSEEKIRRQAQLLDQTHDAIYVRGIGQRIEYWNAAAERLYGWTAAEAIGTRADDLFYRDASQMEARQAVLEKGEWTGELKHVTKSGKEIVVASRRTLLRDASGNPAGILNINTDITEQKKLERQFLQAQRLECVGALAGGIAHDLNNMLAPVLMGADMLRGQVKTADDEQMLDLIIASAKRGADLIRQILAFSKGITSGRSAFDLRHIVVDIEKVLRATFTRGINIENQCPATLPAIKGDPTQIHQVLMNLCINARDAMPNGGTLTIRAGQAERKPGETSVWLQVQDTGMGIPEHLLTRIFEPFFTTKPPEKGTGLGLATVKKILNAHGGTIEVSSSEGQGTTFTCVLPAASSDQAAIAPVGLTAPRGRGESVLVVDDEAALREILSATLESYGYNVTVAANGIDALKALREQRFEILLTDMNMPMMGGGELVRKAAEASPRTVFVLMSGLVEEEADSSDDSRIILQKPFSTAALLNALRSAADMALAKAEPPFSDPCLHHAEAETARSA